MDVTADLDAPCAPDLLFSLVEDLGTYPEWLSIVVRAEPADPDEGDPGPAWTVDLQGRVGPLARSKRLRMVRRVHEAPRRLVFERRQLDGRSHSPWRLEAEVAARDGGSRLTVHLHYGGSFAGSTLERMLHREIEQSRPRLLELVAARR